MKKSTSSEKLSCFLKWGCPPISLLFEKSGMDLTAAGKAGYIKKTAEIPYEGLEQILKAVQSARHDLLINVTAEAVLDSLLLHIKQAAATKM